MTDSPIDLLKTRIDIPGTSNLRDLGGYPVADGRTIARGRLYRSEALARPGAGEMHAVWHEEHEERFKSLQVRTVIDLRAHTEVEKVPSAWSLATGADIHHLPIPEGVEGTDTNFTAQILSGELQTFDADDLAYFYRVAIDRRAATFAAAASVIAQDQQLPVLVHCSAGKDRTGILIALLLEVLGVDRALTVKDYSLTEILRPNRVAAYADMLREAGVDPQAVRTMFETPARVMELSLAHIDSTYGGAASYLIEAGGLQPTELDALRENLLER
jgi:protein-tyrosine phosphatase